MYAIRSYYETGTGKTLAFGLPIVEALLQSPARVEPKTDRS